MPKEKVRYLRGMAETVATAARAAMAAMAAPGRPMWTEATAVMEGTAESVSEAQVAMAVMGIRKRPVATAGMAAMVLPPVVQVAAVEVREASPETPAVLLRLLRERLGQREPRAHQVP